MGKTKLNDLIQTLKDFAPVVSRTGLQPGEEDLIPCNNGIFNFKTKEFFDFDPKYVFTWKTRVDYNPNAINKHFTRQNGEDWSFWPWLVDLMSGAEEDAHAILNMLTFVLRPFSPNHKTFFLFSQSKGNSGKSVIADTICRIIGESAVESITLAKIADRFALTNIPKRCLVLGDDNDYNDYIDTTEVFKALNTSGSLNIERKFKDPLNCRPYLSMIELMNSLPRFSDHSDAMWRRLYALEMFRSFVEGVDEDKAIGTVFLKDKDVLEFILWMTLNRPYITDMPETANSKASLEAIMDVNAPILRFTRMLVQDLEQKGWVSYPAKGAYDLYEAWYDLEYNGDRKYRIQSATKFKLELAAAMEHTDWVLYPNRTFSVKPDQMPAYMDKVLTLPEILAAKRFYHSQTRQYYCLPLRDPFAPDVMFIQSYSGVIERKGA